MDVIKIKNLEFFSNHGVLKEENILGQKFLVSVELHLDTHNSGTTDELENSINYCDVCNEIKYVMENNTFKLIETVAEKISETVLINFHKIEKIITEVKKPWAPVLMPLDYVSVKIEREWHTVYLSLGSNMGEREKYLEDAIAFLSSDKLCKNIKVSDFIETEPYGMTQQDNFINCCIEMKTLRTPHELLQLTSEAEKNAHRERKIHWGPRTLDVDIILYDSLVMHDEKLTIPHIDMANREFVLKPLCQLNPHLKNPVLNQTVYDLLKIINNNK